MDQSAPGRYQAEFDAGQAGSYQLMFSQTQDGRVVGRQSRGLAVGYPDELRLKPVNRDLLQSVARSTGGRFDPSPESVFAPPARSVPRAAPLWPYLLAAAVFLFVADVALRRIDLTLFAGRGRSRLLARPA